MNTFASSFIENMGDGTFTVTQLPNEAQMSSVNTIIVDDYNGDGNLDAFVAGNFYVSEVETPRNDAGTGLVLFGEGDRSFHSIPANKKGVLASYDTRAAAALKTNEGQIIILGNNNEKLRLLKINKKQQQLFC